ncbi:HARB1-like protein, partial [Mya arenaria]
MILVGIVEPTIGPATRGGGQPSPPSHDGIVLPSVFRNWSASHRYCTGSWRVKVGCRQGNSCRICYPFRTVKDVKFPTGLEIESVKRKFYSVAGSPNVVGAVDGTHVKIQAPPDNEADYVNRKGYHSLNEQMVCDANPCMTVACSRRGSCARSWRLQFFKGVPPDSIPPGIPEFGFVLEKFKDNFLCQCNLANWTATGGH